MRILGMALADDELRTLCDLLLDVGRIDDVALAGRLDSARERDVKLLAVSAHERDLILSVLGNPGTPGLAELRGRLQADWEQRLGL